MLYFLILVALYFIPAMVALGRSHRQGVAICLLNLFLGWTLVGWVWALVWAATNGQPQPVVIYAANDQPQPRAPTAFDGQY